MKGMNALQAQQARDFSKSKLSIFASYILAHHSAFAMDMGLSLAIAMVDLAFPYTTRRVINTLLPQKKFQLFFAVMAARAGFAAMYNYVCTVLEYDDKDM